jgi:GNAT superfamily N-acetyltransferase
LAADPELLRAWLTARSVARGLPPPVAEFGGLRIDTNSEKEVRRWVFARAVPGIGALARSIDEPRNFIKLCGTEAELRDELAEPWTIQGGSWFMGFSGEPPTLPPLPTGYALETSRGGGVTHIEIRTNAGELAASGYAAEISEAFVYDRIETDVAHRRRGLGRAIMAALGNCRTSKHARQLLMATAEGERLYSSLGWSRLSPYSTAFLSEPRSSAG